MKTLYSSFLVLFFLFLGTGVFSSHLHAFEKGVAISGDTLSGYGKKVKKVSMSKGFYTVKGVYKAESDFDLFIVKVYDSDGEVIKYLFTESGSNFSGESTLKIPQSGQYVIEVEAAGGWMLIFE